MKTMEDFESITNVGYKVWFMVLNYDNLRLGKVLSKCFLFTRYWVNAYKITHYSNILGYTYIFFEIT